MTARGEILDSYAAIAPDDNITKPAPGPARILLEPDNFYEKARANANQVNANSASAASRGTVRRPYNSITLKEPTTAVLSILGPNNQSIPLIAPNYANGTNQVNEYTDFTLQQVSEQRGEKSQIIETFGDPYVFFYGEQPRIINFAGTLVNSLDYNQRSQFWQNWDQNLRGTQLVKVNARAYVSFDTIVIEGYPLQASASETADSPGLVQFQMQMLVTNYFDYSGVGSITKYSGQGYLGQNYENMENMWYEEDLKQQKIAGDGLLENRSQIESLEAMRRNIYAAQVELQSNFRYQIIQGIIDATDSKWRENAEGTWSSNSWLEDTYYSVNNAINQCKGILEDLSMLANVSDNCFSTITGAVYAPAAALLAAAADPAFTMEAMGFRAMSGDFGSMSETAMRVVDSVSDMENSDKRNEAAGSLIQTAATNALIGGPASLAASMLPDLSTIGTRTSMAAGDAESAVKGFLGSDGNQSFSAVQSQNEASLEAGGTPDATIGGYYGRMEYSAPGSSAPQYESVFGDRDYSGAVDSDPTLQQTLAETYGDVDSAGQVRAQQFEDEPDLYAPLPPSHVYGSAGSETDPAAIESTYRTGVSKKYKGTAQSSLRVLREYGLNLKHPSETRGIRGVDDDNAPIYPVA